MPQMAYKFETEVRPGGKVELTVPVPEGTKVEVLVLTADGEGDELLSAAASSTDFWNNAADDREWNDA